jgi:FtsP/CotA-like multicopper oxidase with cupredoxin domain
MRHVMIVFVCFISLFVCQFAGAQDTLPPVVLTHTPASGTPYNLTMVKAPVQIGPYKVTSNVYNWLYIPRVWFAEPGQTLKFNLRNRLKDEPTNIHTHGLIVSPLGKSDNVFRGVCSLDDTITNCAQSAMAEMMRTCQSQSGFTKDAATCHTEMCGTLTENQCMAHIVFERGQASYAIKIPKSQPLGVKWFHPHMHGVSQAEVSGGMSGLISLGHFCDYLASSAEKTELCKGSKPIVKERYIMLKSTQLVNVNDQLGTAEINPFIAPDFCTGPAKADGSNIGTTCDATKGASDIDMCAKDFTSAGPGFCVGQSNLTSAAPAQDQRQYNCADNPGSCKWAFTLNGATYPNIEFTPNEQQVWRLANVSPDVTYRLSIEKPTANGNTPERVRFTILNIDGVSVASNETNNEAISKTHLILMPGSRADVLVRYVDQQLKILAPQTDQEFQLVQHAVSTGGDFWPRIELAKVTFKGSNSTTLAPLPDDPIVLRSEAAPARSTAELVNQSASIVSRDPFKNYPLCFGATQVRKGKTPTDVTIYFDVSDPEFKLGTVAGNIVTDDAPAFERLPISQKLEKFNASHDQLCIEKGAEVIFNLINVSDEIHNFHIHQAKFAVNGMKERRPADRQFVASFNDSQTHDTVPIPAGVFSDDNGKEMVLPGITRAQARFDLQEQVGHFVFHCHILEHEDGGMMAGVTVVP